MNYHFKKYPFEKILEDYEYIQEEIESTEGTIISDSIISVNCDTVGLKECEKIIFTLKSSLTIGAIILRGHAGYEVPNTVINSESVKSYDKGPVFYTRYIIKSISQSICDYLFNSERIKLLAFKNIPFSNDLQSICSGIRNNKSVKIVYLKKCNIMDEGCIKICQALRRSSVEILGLENCEISSSGVSWICWLLKEQSMIRTLVVWWPNKCQSDNFYKREQGIKKLVLNDNPVIGDAGAKVLINTLLDDKWLSQVHMENTGLTNVTCKLLVPLAEKNNTLEIFDVMKNDITSIGLLALTIERLSVNNSKKNTRNQLKKNVTNKTKLKNLIQNRSKDPSKIESKEKNIIEINLTDSRSSLISDQNYNFTQPSPELNKTKGKLNELRCYKGIFNKKQSTIDWFKSYVKKDELFARNDQSYNQMNTDRIIISRPQKKNIEAEMLSSDVINFKDLIRS